MTPKKAIIIVLVLFLIMIMVFTFLYLKKQSIILEGGQLKTSGESGSRAKAINVMTPEAINQQKDLETKKTIENIIEKGKNEFGGTNIDAIKAAEAVANQRVQEKLNSRTPEQIEADNKREVEIQKMLEEANNKIK